MGDFLKGGKVALATTSKSLTFCDGTENATVFTSAVNKGEIHGGMMTATTYASSMTGMQLGLTNYLVVWDASAVDDEVTFFVSANNITGVSVVAEGTSYVDGTKNTLSFTGYPNSMNFAAGDSVTSTTLVNGLGSGTTYTPTPDGTTVNVTGLSNVKTVAFKIVAKTTYATAHFKTFTVNWAC